MLYNHIYKYFYYVNYMNSSFNFIVIDYFNSIFDKKNFEL